MSPEGGKHVLASLLATWIRQSWLGKYEHWNEWIFVNQHRRLALRW